jgi:hypothetical protein
MNLYRLQSTCENNRKADANINALSTRTIQQNVWTRRFSMTLQQIRSGNDGLPPATVVYLFHNTKVPPEDPQQSKKETARRPKGRSGAKDQMSLGQGS